MDGRQSVLRNFIVLEGIDGAGTTTQLLKFRERCERNGIGCMTTCEPTSGSIGRLIRHFLAGKEPVTPEALALLFAADRHDHLHAPGTGIVDTVGRGTLVVSDRYFFSSLAYQSVQCGFEYVKELNSRFPLPERLVFIDVPAETGMRRIEDRPEREIFENTSFQEKVRGFYREALGLYADSPMKTLILDGRRPADEIADEIWRFSGLLPIQET